MARMSIDAPAPDFTAPSVTGETLSLSRWRGERNVVLVFNRGFI